MRVTEIIKEVYGEDFTEWEMKMISEGYNPEEIKKGSAILGTMLHDCIEKNVTPAHHKVIKALENIKKIFKENKLTVIESPIAVIKFENGQYQYEGTLDFTAKDDKGDLWIVDLKSYGLYDEHKINNEFMPIDSEKKKKVNLQTYLYKNCTHEYKCPVIPRDFSEYKRAILHANHLGAEFIELKRNPPKDILEKVQKIINNSIF